MIPGTALAPFIIESVSPDAMQQWAGFLGDPNPIHLDRVAVAALGLGDRLINQGPANLAYVINLLTANFPDWKIASLETRFNGNVFEGQRAVAGGKVITADEGAISCETWLEIEGRKVVSCKAGLRR